MADVRLTAINPEDSQVYPVACNDKGELLLDSGGASGDLDVTGNLTVAGNTEFGAFDITSTSVDGIRALASGKLQIQRQSSASSDIRFEILKGNTSTASISTDGSASFIEGKYQILENGAVIATRDTPDVSTYGKLVINGTSGTQRVPIQVIGPVGGGVVEEMCTIANDGSANFAGNVSIGGDISNNNDIGILAAADGYFGVRRSGSDVAIQVKQQGNSAVSTAQILANGSATFGGYVTSKSNDAYFAYMGPGGFYGNSNSSTESFRLDSNAGTATFTGNVTAPNINFKLAPADAAAMPAPLIDEGFMANNTVDLLAELIKMKLQIRDLNAFMQRSTQDDLET